MYLKTSTAKVSSMTASLAEKAQLFWSQSFPFEEAVRKDSAVHVSLSSDSLVKQPGTSRLRRKTSSGKSRRNENPLIRRGDANMAIKSMAGCSVTV